MKILLVLAALVVLVGMTVGYWAMGAMLLTVGYGIVVLNDVLRSEEAWK